MLFYFINNAFYLLLYFCLLILFIGIFIGFYQMELFTGFLYVLELTIIFITLLILFYLNIKGEAPHINSTKFVYIFVLLPVLLLPTAYFELELFLPINFINIDIWDNYYSAVSHLVMNDFLGLYISYYFLNSHEFLLIGLMLFIGSIVCVVLFNLVGITKNINYTTLKDFLSFFFENVDYYFLRKQNLFNQTSIQPHLRVLKNKSL